MSEIIKHSKDFIRCAKFENFQETEQEILDRYSGDELLARINDYITSWFIYSHVNKSIGDIVPTKISVDLVNVMKRGLK